MGFSQVGNGALALSHSLGRQGGGWDGKEAAGGGGSGSSFLCSLSSSIFQCPGILICSFGELGWGREGDSRRVFPIFLPISQA